MLRSSERCYKGLKATSRRPHPTLRDSSSLRHWEAKRGWRAALPSLRTCYGREVAVTKLIERRVEKVWGRRNLPPMFGSVDEAAEPIGEIWFEYPAGDDVELLVKYLFTSEKLSIQVHPDDATAKRAGHERGKNEAWFVLEAEPGAVIGLGLKQPVSSEQLRNAALDGSLEALLDWRPVAAGDFFYSPAGTIHALGAGLTLIEIQQNADVTYRLYDYGRPRQLHVKEAVAAAVPQPYVAPMNSKVRIPGRDILAQGAFVVERWADARFGKIDAADHPVWLIPIAGAVQTEGTPLPPGTVWVANGVSQLTIAAGSELLAAYPGAWVRESLVG
jgi:mannose-6-phosphate isomerase